MPFGFLIPQKLGLVDTGISGVFTAGGVSEVGKVTGPEDEVPVTGGNGIGVGVGVGEVPVLGRGKFGFSPPSGNLQHTSSG